MILTLLCDRFIVQAADRRVTYGDGRVSEVMNKTVIVAGAGTAAYTGLAFVDGRNPTDLMLIDSLARSFKNRQNALERLAHDAERAIRLNRSLPKDVTERSRLARTSFVLGFFKNPGSSGGPSLAVVSNAQGDFTEAWRETASKRFGAVAGDLPLGQTFLHVAGQPLPASLRARLVRQSREVIRRGNGPEAAARLLARAIQDVSSTNPGVGSNVTCILVRNMSEPLPSASGEVTINAMGLIPLGEHALREANFFTSPHGDVREEQITSIFLPDARNPEIAYGPSYVSPDFQLHSPVMGPDYMFQAAQQAVENLRAGKPVDLRVPPRFRRMAEPRVLP
jgi:hypothetical protein